MHDNMEHIMNPKSKRSMQEIVSRRIKMLRIRKGLTQKSLAKAAGLHWTYLAKIETGKKLPLLKTICALADILEVETHELLIPEETQGKLSQKKKQLIKVIEEESTPEEIDIYLALINSLNKKRAEKPGWIG